MSAWIQRAWQERRGPLLAGLAASLLAGLLALTPLLERGELLAQDARFRLRGRRESHAPIVIVEITEEERKTWSEPDNAWGPHYRAAIEQARHCGAQWIGVDIFFEKLDEGPSLRSLQVALSEGGVVLVNARGKAGEPLNPKGELLAVHPAENVGFSNSLPEADGSIRRAPLFARGSEGLLPAFAAVLALRMQGRSPWDEGALRSLSTAGDADLGALWINYVGPPGPVERGGSFTYLPMRRLATGALSAAERQLVRGAVVLIGVTGSLEQDWGRGPADRDYPGVEIHAHALATLLDGRPLRRVSRASEALGTALLGVGVALGLAFLSISRGLGAALAGAVVWCGLAQGAFVADALWPVAGPLLAFGLVWSAQAGARAVEEARRRAWIEEQFDAYFSDGVRQFLALHPEVRKEGGEVEKRVTVLMLDIRGFTATAEYEQPAQVLEGVNQFLEAVGPAIEQRQGMVLEFTGDGLVAVFGALGREASHAQDAVAAAIAAARIARSLAPPRRIGCGVNSGPVAFGYRGTRTHAQLAGAGDTLNVAARLEQLNKKEELNTAFPSEVLFSAATHQALTVSPPTEGPFEYALHNHAEAVWVYQVRIDE